MRLSPRLCFGWSKLPRREWTRLGPSRHGCGRGRPWRDRCIQPPQGQAAGWGRTSPRLAAGTLASLFFAILALALVVSVKTAVMNWFMSSTQAKKWAMSSLSRVHVAIDRATAKVKYQFPFISSSHPFSSKEWASERPDCFSYSAWVDSQNMSRIYLSLLFYESASSDDYMNWSYPRGLMDRPLKTGCRCTGSVKWRQLREPQSSISSGRIILFTGSVQTTPSIPKYRSFWFFRFIVITMHLDITYV